MLLISLAPTRAVILTQATEQAASIQERKFNVIATRRVLTWDGTNVVGSLIDGSGLTASRRFADILLHYFLDPRLGGRAISDLDVQELYEIQTRLDSVFGGEKGEFSFTFDDNNVPAIEEMRQIANAARCLLIRNGSYFTIVRDEPQEISGRIIQQT